jgi:hypothetical protein
MASISELQSVAAEAKLALAQADVDREQVCFWLFDAIAM